jgi:hypothetical protein
MNNKLSSGWWLASRGLSDLVPTKQKQIVGPGNVCGAKKYLARDVAALAPYF